MDFEKREFYLTSPSGDVTLVEAYLRNNQITILFGTEQRIDLNLTSAFELADCLLMLLGGAGDYHEEY